MFVKLLHLDLNWHLNKQTGKVVEVVNRGLDSLQFLMNNALVRESIHLRRTQRVDKTVPLTA